MKKLPILILVASSFLLLSACEGKTDSAVSSTTTEKQTTTTKSSTPTSSTSSKEKVNSQTSQTSSSSTTSSTTKDSQPTTSTEKVVTNEDGKQLLVGKWKTKDPNAHVIIEYTFAEDGTYINYSDARGTELTGTYEVTAYDGTNISITTHLNNQDQVLQYEVRQNQTELYMQDPASGMVQEFVKGE